MKKDDSVYLRHILDAMSRIELQIANEKYTILQPKSAPLYLKKSINIDHIFLLSLQVINLALPAIPWSLLAGKNCHSYLAYMTYE